MLKGYYSDIEFLPLDRWIKANSGVLCALRVKDEDETNLDYSKYWKKENDKKAWVNVFNDFLKRVGVSDEYQEYLNDLRRCSEMQIQYLETRERALLNDINLIKARIEKYEKDNRESKATIWNTLNDLSRVEGRTIVAKDLMTLQYFELLKKHSNG